MATEGKAGVTSCPPALQGPKRSPRPWTKSTYQHDCCFSYFKTRQQSTASNYQLGMGCHRCTNQGMTTWDGMPTLHESGNDNLGWDATASG
eukprot:6455625-Amphidinium_carterae.1